jgi:peptidoglycan-N-acetylglucosamine deacetylase
VSSARKLLKAAASRLLPPSLLVLRGPPDRRQIALTFDDGPEQHLDAYLEVLDRYGARATFFLLGECMAVRRAGLRELVRRGHEVASHGYSHKRFTQMTRVELDDELTRTNDELPVSSRVRPLCRPPQGAVDLQVLAHLTLRGYTTVLWSLDSDDCRTEDPKTIAERVSPANVSPGEIVLLHEGQRWTLEALPPILDGLTREGYQLVTVGEMLS